MLGKTHMAGGIAAGSLFLYTTNSIPAEAHIPFFAACTAGALLPDICSPQSTIGRKLPILSRVFSGTFGHRTFTHSLAMLVLIWFGFGFLDWSVAIKMGLFLGIVSHLILDALTEDGIQFLWPFKIRIGLPSIAAIRTGGIFENIYLAAIVAIIAYTGFNMYI